MIYPGDYLRDPVAACSISAQGLWFRMLLMMHDSDRYGYLSVNGSPIPPAIIARHCGCETLAQYETLLAELDSVGAPSRTANGTIFNRRMVRNAKERAQEAERKRRTRMSGACPGNVRHLSAHTEDESETENETETNLGIEPVPEVPMPNCLLTEAFKAKWAEYVAHRRASHFKPLKPASVAKQWAKLAEWGHDRAIEAIDQTIRNGWQGLFEPKAVSGHATAPAPRPDIYTEPADWRLKAAAKWPGITIPARWADLSATMRNDLVAAP
ncbi:MAG TPA: hypothetical protein VEC57_00275 [Candidatus Limnocylindrales bacterium]|nr:hypothetical protein [Candidatus Limnocylindrales bacterium]